MKREHKPVVHLYRGAPAVRSWSKYQQTDTKWTLCGIKSGKGRKGVEFALRCSEDERVVSCSFCHQLMQISPARHGKNRVSTEAA